MITRADVEAARPIVAEAALNTPLVRLDVETEGQIWLKLENLQPIGSFKLRGAYHAARRLTAEQRAIGLVTASSGNMAQGVAYSARRLGVRSTAVVPEGAPRTKLEAIRRLGGGIVEAPFDEFLATFRRRAFPGLAGTFVHAFDDDAVMAGNGTVALELLDDLPGFDVLVVPFGGGGLAVGAATVIRDARPDVEIVAAQTANGAPLVASLAAGRSVEVAYTPSLADGIAGSSLFPRIWSLSRTLIDRAVSVSEGEIKDTIRVLASRARIVAEGSAAAAVAVAVRESAAGRRVACIVSGGNIDLPKLVPILAAGDTGGSARA